MVCVVIERAISSFADERSATLPDLVFVRRRGLEYSFTGEKLTAEQCSIVFEQLRAQYPAVFANKYLTCVPSQPSTTMPHYKVLLVGERKEDLELESLAALCDELLGQVNCEYRSKRASGRLGAVTFIETGTREFAEQFCCASRLGIAVQVPATLSSFNLERPNRVS